MERSLAHPVRDVWVGAVDEQQFETFFHLVVVVRLDVALDGATDVPQQHVQSRVAVLIPDVDVRTEAVVKRELRRLHESEGHLRPVEFVERRAVLRQEDVLLKVGPVVHQEDRTVGVGNEAVNNNNLVIIIISYQDRRNVIPVYRDTNAHDTHYPHRGTRTAYDHSRQSIIRTKDAHHICRVWIKNKI